MYSSEQRKLHESDYILYGEDVANAFDRERDAGVKRAEQERALAELAVTNEVLVSA